MMNVKDIKVLSVGTLGNAQIDVDASASYDWCEGLYLKPPKGARELTSKNEVDSLRFDLEKYDAILLWHQNLNIPTIALLNKILKKKKLALIIGNSHGYNKSISELIELYGLKVPNLYMDYYSMWGQYFTDRYKYIYKKDPLRNHLLSLGSIRHDYLYKNYRWNKNKTKGKVLVIHEPVTAESWNDPSPIGDNRVTEVIIENLRKNGIPFDFKVHPNWPDFISNSGKPMWKPPSNINIVNIPIQEMINYDAVIASWSSIQFEALAMGIPVINIKYDYPTLNNSEWGPAKLGLLKPTEAKQIHDSFYEIEKNGPKVDMGILKYFLGELGNVDKVYYEFIEKYINHLNSFPSARFKKRFMRKIYYNIRYKLRLIIKHLISPIVPYIVRVQIKAAVNKFRSFPSVIIKR